MTRAKAGQLGGLVTSLRHGHQHYQEIGAKGGRPKKQLKPVPKVEKIKIQEEQLITANLGQLSGLAKSLYPEFC